MKKYLVLTLLLSLGLAACAHQPAIKPENVFRVYFNTGEDTLDCGDKMAIKDAAKAFKKEGFEVILSGHTDRVGNPETNVALSKARSIQVTAALVKAGVPRELIVTRYYGDEAAALVAKERAGVPSKESRRVTIIVR